MSPLGADYSEPFTQKKKSNGEVHAKKDSD